MMYWIIPIFLFFVPLAIKLFKDFDDWKSGRSVNHNAEWKWVAGAEMGLSGIFFIFQKLQDSDPRWHLLYLIPIVGGMIASWFLFLFDGIYNLLRRWYRKKRGEAFRHYTWWYLGTDDDDDATTDNILQRLKLWQHVSLKVGLIIIFTSLYIIV